MSSDIPLPDAAHPDGTMPHWHLKSHVPVIIALIGIGIIYAVISEQLLLGPRWLLLELIIPLVAIILVAIRRGHFGWSRRVGLLLLGTITIAEAISTSFLVGLLISASEHTAVHDTAIILLRDASLLWIANVLTFALWYWELDDGGPGKRHRDGYQSKDFLFPQRTLDPPDMNWCPQFVDYLFLAFNTSTAFSPTDTLVLSQRAKLLLMIQALISLAVLAIIAARAINTL
jgi:hypothetical protein